MTGVTKPSILMPYTAAVTTVPGGLAAAGRTAPAERPIVVPAAAGQPTVLLLARQPDWIGPARLPAMLRQAGCRVAVFSEAGSLVARSRHVDDVVDLTVEGGDYFEALRCHLACYGDRYDWVLPTTDADLRGLHERLDQRWAAEIFPADVSLGGADALVSKTGFAEAMRRLGVPVPPSAVVQSLEEATAEAARIGYPVVLEALDGSRSRRIWKASDAGALAVVYAKAGGGELLLRRYVDGEAGSVQALFDGGAPLCWTASYQAHVRPRPAGPSSRRHFRAHPELQSHLRRIGAGLGLHGFVTLDFVLAADTRNVCFLALAARPAPFAHLHTIVRADFPAAIRSMLTGAPALSAIKWQSPRERAVRLFPQDLIQAAEERDWGTMVNWAITPSEWGDVPFGEPGLLLEHLRLIRRAVGRGRR